MQIARWFTCSSSPIAFRWRLDRHASLISHCSFADQTDGRACKLGESRAALSSLHVNVTSDHDQFIWVFCPDSIVAGSVSASPICSRARQLETRNCELFKWKEKRAGEEVRKYRFLANRYGSGNESFMWGMFRDQIWWTTLVQLLESIFVIARAGPG